MNDSNLFYQGHVKHILQPLKRMVMDKQKVPSEAQILWLNFDMLLNPIIGPSGVRALPLAAGINEGGHYFRYFSFFFLPPLFKTTEGVVVGFQIFAWAPKKK